MPYKIYVPTEYRGEFLKRQVYRIISTIIIQIVADNSLEVIS